MNYLNKALSFIILGSRPLLGDTVCRYKLSCTRFAVKQLHEKPLFTAIWRITKRVVCCNPFTKPRNDLQS